MESFFAYSQSTAFNHHRFPCQLSDIRGRVIFVEAITQRYRLFVITLESLHHCDFIFTYLRSLITRFETHAKDVRFLILCPGSKDQLLSYLQKKHFLMEEMVYWMVSAHLARQLQIYQTQDHYCGTFLLEVHTNGYWQIIRQIEPEDDKGMDWLTWSLVSARQECEQLANTCIKSSQAVLIKLVQKKRSVHHHHHHRPPNNTITAATSTSWGWSMCPLEIQHAILDQMAIPDIMQCAQACDDDDSSSNSSSGSAARMHDVIMTWLIQRLEAHLRGLTQCMPVKLLQYHERQLSWLLFQIQPYLTSYGPLVTHRLK